MHGGRLLRIGASMDLGGLMARAMGGGLVWVLGSCARVREALSVNVCRSIWRRDVVEVLRGGHSTAVPSADCRTGRRVRTALCGRVRVCYLR